MVLLRVLGAKWGEKMPDGAVRMRQSLGLSLMVVLALASAVPAWAQLADQVPPQLEEVGIQEHLDAKIPMDLEFRDEYGAVVTLGDYFDGTKPVILTLNYYKCPMLCGLQLNGLLDGLKDLDWTPGQEFELVTVSINPLETPALATEKKQNYMKRYERPSAAKGWHFLTGKEPGSSPPPSASATPTTGKPVSMPMRRPSFSRRRTGE